MPRTTGSTGVEPKWETDGSRFLQHLSVCGESLFLSKPDRLLLLKHTQGPAPV